MRRLLAIAQISAFFVIASSKSSLAFESAKVLPKGIRSVTLKNVHTQVNSKTDSEGDIEPLATPLEKEINYGRILKGEKGTKRDLLAAFLEENGLKLTDSLGQFNADLKAKVDVYASLFSYGLTDRLTAAFVVPYYNAKSRVAISFRPDTMRANKFISLLSDPIYNQTESAREVASKLNGAVSELNKKLRDNGFHELADWEGSGLGDLTLAGKYLVFTSPMLQVATLTGTTLPTGRVKDPNLLNDIPFGKGTYGFFTQAIADIKNDAMVLNQSFKYTYYLPGSRNLRYVTEDESIEIDSGRTGFKLGDELLYNISMQHEMNFGLMSGLGFVFSKKYTDHYLIENNQESKSKLQADTDQRATYWEAKVGYSGINAYKSGLIPAPFIASVEYKRHIASISSLKNDFITADLSLFF